MFDGVDHSLAVFDKGQYTGYVPGYLELITEFAERAVKGNGRPR